jgi:5-oxoprolinase (ATP-hydrolysing)
VELEQAPDRPVAKGTCCELRAGVEAPLLAAHLVTRTSLTETLPEMAMRLASTRATNALLERRGAPTVLFITQGFADLLAIGTQQRPDLFALQVRKPDAFHAAVVEVPERLAADGSVLEALDLERLRPRAAELLDQGHGCAAVALLHSYRNPAHEQALAAFLREVGFAHVSCSAGLAPLIRLLPRAETAVIDAYLAPVIGDYLKAVSTAVTTGTLHVMTSAGGLVAAEMFRPKDALLSGPAGGVVGAALAGRRSGFERVIAFDMGGTSTDVARWDGDFEYVFEHTVGDAHLAAPALAISTVAAGGGSVCRFDGPHLKVGPDSAGAEPGPACYGTGGPLTLTDVNLLLGRLAPERFEIPIDPTAAARALESSIAAVDWGDTDAPTREEVLSGFLDIANERMAAAIRRISIRRGYDPRRYALVAFGGAGPQHACAVARLLGIHTVVVPHDASLLSACGLGNALVERFAHRQVLKPLDEVEERIAELLSELSRQATALVVAEGIAADQVVVRRRLAHLRLLGQDAVLEVEWSPGADLGELFLDRYRAIFGYHPPARPIELESMRVIASTLPRATAVAEEPAHAHQPPRPRIFASGPAHGIPVYDRSDLRPGALLSGPALVLERHSATVVYTGWRLRVDGAEALVLTRREAGDAA